MENDSACMTFNFIPYTKCRPCYPGIIISFFDHLFILFFSCYGRCAIMILNSWPIFIHHSKFFAYLLMNWKWRPIRNQFRKCWKFSLLSLKIQELWNVCNCMNYDMLSNCIKSYDESSAPRGRNSDDLFHSLLKKILSSDESGAHFTTQQKLS